MHIPRCDRGGGSRDGVFTQQREYPRIIRPSSRPSVRLSAGRRVSTQPRDSNPPSNRCVAMASAPICRSSWRRGVVEESRAKNINCAPSRRIYTLFILRADWQTDGRSLAVVTSAYRSVRYTADAVRNRTERNFHNRLSLAGPVVYSSAKMLHITVSKAIPTDDIFPGLKVLKVNCNALRGESHV